MTSFMFNYRHERSDPDYVFFDSLTFHICYNGYSSTYNHSYITSCYESDYLGTRHAHAIINHCYDLFVLMHLLPTGNTPHTTVITTDTPTMAPPTTTSTNSATIDAIITTVILVGGVCGLIALTIVVLTCLALRKRRYRPPKPDRKRLISENRMSELVESEPEPFERHPSLFKDNHE